MSIRPWAWLVVGAVAGAVSATAQSLVYAEHKGQFSLVTRVERDTPMVLVDGKLETGSKLRYALRPVAKFAPYFVTVRDLKLSSRWMEFVGDTKALNNEFSFEAEFESSYRLADVFVVVEIDGEKGGKSLLVREVGELLPRIPVRLSFRVQLAENLGSFRYTLHVFAGGPEVFNSKLPTGRVSQALDQLVTEKLAGVRNAAPQPLIGPPPVYPKALASKRVTGSATVSFGVTPTGVVLDPVVQTATEPAFGEAALQAIREWRFVPKVVDGRRVEGRVSIPFSFTPPPP